MLLPVLLVVGGCSTAPAVIDPGGTPDTPVLPSPSAPTSTPQASGLGYEEDMPSAGPSPTWDAAARSEAVQHARTTMAAFARAELSEEQWWSDLAPLLTLSAQDAYSAVDPANVPARQVTGDAVLTDDSSAWLARLDVPTDVGTYELLLARDGATAPWRTEAITPPAALSQPAGR